MDIVPRRNIRLPRSEYIGRRLYFLTICSENRRPIFQDSNRAKILIEALKRVSDSMGVLVHAFCVMPDHVHTLAEGNSAASDIVKFVAQWKQSTGYLFRHELSKRFWQRRFYDHVLRRAEDSDPVAWYIWMNPVRKGMVAELQQYPFSGSFTVQWPIATSGSTVWIPPWKTGITNKEHPKKGTR